MSYNEKLWVEKYRPQVLDDCVLSSGVREIFENIIAKGEIPHMLLSAPQGCGKTASSQVLCRLLDCDVLFINASDENGIDVLRTKIKGFASSVSLDNKKKIVFLDEADYMNAQSMQPALRGVMEEFSDNCRFILTCNFKNRIIAPIHSRCMGIDLRVPTTERTEVAKGIMKRLTYILQSEGVTNIEPKALVNLIVSHSQGGSFDIRRMINELQRNVRPDGTMGWDKIATSSETNITGLVGHLKKKSFTDTRKWVSTHCDGDPTAVFSNLLNHLEKVMKADSLAQAYVIVAEYADKATRVADQQVNTTAAMAELMSSCKFE